jgi:hypothetical protein
MGNVNVLTEMVDYKKVLAFINNVWAKSLWAIVLFLLGLWIGSVNTESRIAGDCKFAGAFRVDIQAFACQRRL